MRNKLSQIRFSKGYTQKRLCEESGISLAMYTFAEQGRRRPSIETWKKIQQVLEIPDSEMWSVIFDQAEKSRNFRKQ